MYLKLVQINPYKLGEFISFNTILPRADEKQGEMWLLKYETGKVTSPNRGGIFVFDVNKKNYHDVAGWIGMNTSGGLGAELFHCEPINPRQPTFSFVPLKYKDYKVFWDSPDKYDWSFRNLSTTTVPVGTMLCDSVLINELYNLNDFLLDKYGHFTK